MGFILRLRLIEALEHKSDFSNVPNLYFINDGKLIKNEISTTEAAKFTIPNFDGFPLDKYFMQISIQQEGLILLGLINTPMYG